MKTENKPSQTTDPAIAVDPVLGCVNLAKDTVAKRHGYSRNILGTSWEYAMMLTHRKKAQLALYEEVINELEMLLAIAEANECQRRRYD
jgi:hypothetical protein